MQPSKNPLEHKRFNYIRPITPEDINTEAEAKKAFTPSPPLLHPLSTSTILSLFSSNLNSISKNTN